MICRRCLQRASARNTLQSSVQTVHEITTSAAGPHRITTFPQPRFLSTSSHRTAEAISSNAATQAKARQTSPTSPEGPPSATSTSVAQPFSTPLTPSPAAQGVKSTKARAPAVPVSSVPAGAVLRGLNYLKNKTDPIALEDSEYPSWLWSVLAEKKGAQDGDADAGDLFSKSKKQRRLAAKRLRKQALLHPESFAPKIPLQEQSIDLPAGDGSVKGAVEALESREELTRAMRAKRRGSIKEDNFLRSMR
ncbi:MAG: hypothetical protein M1819_004936 [Sarea resinae]|nr:MAG: hypothetical protein M1819_004936 [Sarea resinae]